MFALQNLFQLGAACLALAAVPLPASLAATPDATSVSRSLSAAERSLMQGRADDAAAALHRSLAVQPGNGPAHLLLCRTYLSEELATQAVAECQAALDNGLAANSAAQDWTGRARGMAASRAGMLSGMKLALGVRNAFEAAVRLDPASEAANVDLGEYYTAAPAIVGGGTDKALALADRIDGTLPETAHRIRAMAAEKNKDLVTAEREFQAEVAVAHRPGALVDLAAFYNRHGDPGKAAATARQILASDRQIDASVAEAAGVLQDAHQPTAAAEALRAYLARGVKSDQAPVFRVHTALGGLLAQAGDKDAARAEYQQALVLASQYAPAQKGLESL